MASKPAIFLLAAISLQVITTSSTAQDSADPCSQRVCMWGEMCMADSAGFTYCECPASCPDVYDPVCSVYGIQFPSRCHLHMFACTEGVNIALKNKGPCVNKTTGSDPEPDPRSQVCPDMDHMAQFRDRFLEWMYVTKEQTQDRSFNLTTTRRIYDLTLSEKTEIAQWEFRRHDVNKDNALHQQELDPILQVMVFEPCGAGFLWSCDADAKDGISSGEWSACFNLAERSPFRKNKL